MENNKLLKIYTILEMSCLVIFLFVIFSNLVFIDMQEKINIKPDMIEFINNYIIITIISLVFLFSVIIILHKCLEENISKNQRNLNQKDRYYYE